MYLRIVQRTKGWRSRRRLREERGVWVAAAEDESSGGVTSFLLMKKVAVLGPIDFCLNSRPGELRLI